jgi:phage tail sheath gpL-like
MAVTSTAVPAGAVASVFGNEFNYVNLREGLAGLPQVIAIFATYDPLKTAVVANEPVRVFTGVEAGEKFGFGFPAHLAARQVLRKSGIVPVFIFPIAEAGGAVAGDGNILFSGTSTSSGTLSLYIGGQLVRVTIADNTTPADIATAVTAAINANINLPVTAVVNGVTAEQVDITSKYKGAIADDITVVLNLTEQEKDNTPASVSAVITALTNGAGVPAVTTALGNFGDDWYTYVVNTFGTDTTVMDELATFNDDDRWDTLVNKFFRAFYGSVDDFSTITAVTDARKLDRTNGVIHSPSAYALPLELASLAVGQMAARNQNDPAQPYTGLTLDGLVPGAASAQLSYTQRDAALKLGTGTTILEDGVIKLEDVAMHYHKTGEEPPAYRWSVDIAKLAQWAFSVSLVFEGSNWRGKILVDDGDVVVNPNARRPLDSVAEIFKIADAASAAAIITRPETTKENTVASIDVSNPNRLNISTLIVLSGTTRIISLTTNFGFNFGALAA